MPIELALAVDSSQGQPPGAYTFLRHPMQTSLQPTGQQSGQPSTQAPTKRLKVLLIAERANPEYGSIPLRGWCHGRAISEVADVHIVTQHWNGPAFLRAGFTDFTGLDTSMVHEPTKLLISALRGGKGKGWTLDTALSGLEYYYFEWRVWQQFGQRIRAGEFDIVHRLIPSTPTVASTIAKKCKQAGVPFVLGPLNGGLPWPKGFNTVRHQEKEWLSYIRDVYRFLPAYKSTRQNASAIMVGSQSTLEQVDSFYREKCVYFPANAVGDEWFDRQRKAPAQRPLKVIFVGRLVPYKGADMLIEAAAPLLKAGDITLEIIGNGPNRSALETQVTQADLSERVTFTGNIPHDQLQARLAEADVFAFPSIREFGGAVVIEAMAIGLLPVVVDYGGPGEMVTASTGYKVPMGPRDEIVAGFRRVFGELVAHPERIDLMGARSRQRVRSKFTWQVRAEQTLEVYRWVLSENRPKPHYDYSG